MTYDPELDRISLTIVNSIAELFAEPDFDSDSGGVRLIDRDDRCVWLGLFSTDDDGEPIGKTPSVTWTIEISRDAE